VAISIAVSASVVANAAGTETVIHNFSTTANGKNPRTGPVIDASTGAFYGVAAGGTNGQGLVYQILPPKAGQSKWTYTVIYNNPANADPLTTAYNYIYASKNVIYVVGGTAVFSLTPPQSGTGDWTPTVLHAFSRWNDGKQPEGPLAMDSHGALYGTTVYGGTGCQKYTGCGTVYELAPPMTQGQPWSFSVLYHFPGGAAGEKPLDGVIFDKQGNLYGSAAFDFPSGKSLIFKLTPPSGAGEWTESVLYHFYPTSTCYSGGPLAIDANGALYGGFSAFASLGYGCNDTEDEYAFQLAPSQADPNVWVRTKMRVFSNSNLPGGFNLKSPLTVDSSGNVYGATQLGGTPGGGTAFVLKPRPGVPGKWNYGALFDFLNGGTGGANTTGDVPNGGLVFDPAGALYGTTQTGGNGNHGVVFQLTP